MIPHTDDITLVDTLPGNETDFTIGDPRWTMRLLSRVYSNPELAVAREYSTNGYDAAKERALLEGVDVPPIEVTLPSMMNPFFIVRDYGYGMDAHTLTERFTVFGDSTKRDSNEYNGMLGVGCKSALAYTNTFVVTTIHNGTKIVATVTRQPDWSIKMRWMDPVRTTEPSGTEIKVPVHNWQEFAQKAADYYRFWLPGRVKVNGEFPKQSVGEKITDGLYLSTQWNTSYVVMGNVPYRIANPDALFRNSKMNRVNFVAYTDTGDVDFTPSREDLEYTPRTKAALQKIIDDFATQVVDKANDEIAAATTHSEAFKAWSKWVGFLGRDLFADLEFKGDKFRSNFAINAQRYDNYRSSYSVQRISDWHVESMPNTMVVTEFDIEMSSVAKRKARQYAELKGWTNPNETSLPRYVLFTRSTADEIDCPWITKEHFVSWATIKAELPKAPRVNTGGGKVRIKGTFDYYTAKGKEFEAELPEDVEIFWVRTHEWKRYSISLLLDMVAPDAVAVVLSENRITKWQREHPKSQNIYLYARSKVVTDCSTLLSDDAKEVRRLGHDSRRWLKRLDLTKVNDPEWHRLVKLMNTEDNLLKAFNENIRLAQATWMNYSLKNHEVDDRHEIFDRYPLLKSLSNYGTLDPHVYLYINAVYAAEEKE